MGLRVYKIDKLPEGNTHCVRWTGKKQSGVSKPMGKEKAEHLAKVGNEWFTKCRHVVERVGA
jgi:hypothetical protein